MSFFRTKSDAEPASESAKSVIAPPKQGSSLREDLSRVLINPRITEKSTDMNAIGAYVFNISTRANKGQVSAAIRAVYKVTPLMVRIVPIRAKNIRNARTGMMGVKSGGKKAYVYLKKGDTISVI